MLYVSHDAEGIRRYLSSPGVRLTSSSRPWSPECLHEANEVDRYMPVVFEVTAMSLVGWVGLAAQPGVERDER